MMTDLIELHLNCTKSSNLTQICQQQDHLEFVDILKCLDNGAVWLTHKNKTKRVFDPTIIIEPEQTLHIYCNEFTLQESPYTPILVEDLGDFSVWFKPSGMLSQGSKFGSHWSIHRWIEQNVFQDRQCFITHRLDRFTQGLMIVAHNKDANFKLHRLFENRSVKKTYRAITKGLFPIGDMVEVDSKINHQNALSVMTGLEQNKKTNRSLIAIAPKTGRKHQVRRHLSFIGHPVINDRQYGEEPFEGDLMLQAAELQFNHPLTDEPLHFTLPNTTLLTLETL